MPIGIAACCLVNLVNGRRSGWPKGTSMILQRTAVEARALKSPPLPAKPLIARWFEHPNDRLSKPRPTRNAMLPI